MLRTLTRRKINDPKLKHSNVSEQSFLTRANKTKSKKLFFPSEYGKISVVLNYIIESVNNREISIEKILFLVSIKLLQSQKLILDNSIQEIVDGSTGNFIPGKSLKHEILLWKSQISNNFPQHIINYLEKINFETENDILGLLYQSTLEEGQKSKNGSYYTPKKITENIVYNRVKSWHHVYDPCCGSAQFLLACKSIITNPLNLYGQDADSIAVQIARINLILAYPKIDFTPNITCKNSLIENQADLFSSTDIERTFDVIITNPPWGSSFTDREKNALNILYPNITSTESFSYFIQKAYSQLKKGGIASFILPESILNVKAHNDIRFFILNNCYIEKISYLGRIFTNVFTPVIQIDIVKKDRSSLLTTITINDNLYQIPQDKWLTNSSKIIDIHADTLDDAIIQKVYTVKHTTLKNQADWGLGIVTGNNKLFLKTTQETNCEAIYTGKQVDQLILKAPAYYIHFIPKNFQQVSKENIYRTPEKLIYKFISKKLVFAKDNTKALTLNSANIVVPKITSYPMQVIALLFNSELYNFIFRKKFNSIKILRSHLEALPIPLFGSKTINHLSSMADEWASKKITSVEIDEFLYALFEISSQEQFIIKNMK